jgi:opacity protein-like surface antigen
MKKTACRLGLLVTLVAIAGFSTVHADEEGWGVRFGFGDDPDQVVVGAQYDVGEVVDHVHVVPMFEIGFGDDATVVSFSGMAYWHFKKPEKIDPYAGAGIEAGWIDFDGDAPGGDDSDFEIQVNVLGGLRFPLKNKNEMFVELILGSGDLHDAKIMGGFRF